MGYKYAKLYTPFIHAYECYGLITKDHIPIIDENRYWVSNYSCVVYDAVRNVYIPPNSTPSGYYLVSLHTEKGMKTYLLHRLVGMVFIPGDFSLQINHINGKKHDCTVDNLEWVTCSQNLRHALETGLHKRGEDKSNAILTNDQVHTICKCLEQRYRISEILQILGLENTPKNRDLIVDVKRGKTFTFISKDYHFDNDALCEREFSNEQVHQICQMYQTNPGIKTRLIFDALGLQEDDPEKRHKLLGKIRSVKDRKAYTDISKEYTW